MGERKVPTGTAIVMVGVAAAADLIGGLISGGLLDWLFDPFIGLFFGAWLSFYDINMFSTDHVLGTLVTFVVDAIPEADFVGPWAWRVGKLVISERKQVAANDNEPQKQRKSFGWGPERVAANDNNPSLDKAA